MNNIKHWRPQRFRDFVGEQSKRTLHRLRLTAKQRRPLAGLLIGPYGSAKTSIARLLMKSYICQRVDPETSDPCGMCQHCIVANPDHNGECHTFQHWEVDCNQSLDREELSHLVDEAQSRIWPPFIILDDAHRLSQRSAQEVFQVFAEDLRVGVLLATVMTEPNRPPVPIKPSLFERLKKFYVSIPEADEMTAFLWDKLLEWEITSSRGVVQQMVVRSERSFRTCLNILDEARHTNGGVLSLELIDDVLPDCKSETQAWENPFADDDEDE